jgi:hypothetical protein
LSDDSPTPRDRGAGGAITQPDMCGRVRRGATLAGTGVIPSSVSATAAQASAAVVARASRCGSGFFTAGHAANVGGERRSGVGDAHMRWSG